MKILFIDRSTRLKTVHDLDTIPRGGMVQSLFRVSDYLASKGHTVHVYSDIIEGGYTEAGAWWVPNSNWQLNNYDVLICNRGVGTGYPEINAKRRVLWTHDLPHSGFIPEPKMASVFETVFMSRYSERVWRKFYKDIGKSYFIPNGVDDYFFPREKDLKKIVYFFHPNRGLKRLDFIAACIKARVPGVQVEAYSSGLMYPTDNEVLGDHVDMDLPHTTGNVALNQPVVSADLADIIGRAGLTILPTGYPEICSNSVLQSLKSGTPLVTTGGLGATPEWVKHNHNGLLTTFLPNDYMVYTVEIVRMVTSLLSDKKRHLKLINNSSKTPVWSWEKVGRAWLKLLS